MPLSAPVARRALRHTRSIQVLAFQREDGLWDLEACLRDVKSFDVTLASGTRPAHSNLHDLHLRLTIDTDFVVRAAEASSDAVPYPGYCERIGPAYQQLVGLSLMRGFRQGVKERLSGVLGCTHLTELAQVLPTAAIQAFANDVLKTRDGEHDDGLPHQPFQLDKCHALRTDGPGVARFYPRWAVAPGALQTSSDSSIYQFQEGKPA
ncbi:DUF2889 domain-containing protein [Massilia sp. TS11]|uniref:DUF2889 domain-containing protein n=1 Tax=Massilia sp. TS11 TaxID=2908003 RepID=UPI001EDBCDBE|nr:DUF2889 domain-containing protein [Massilia sp. TS11]MCG2586448.1 DUF2889 domain-containing protein [Massilia sp. TS11]